MATSELEDLRSFLEQRFAEAYPEIDTSAGSVADTQIITPLVNRLSPDPYDTPIDTYLKTRLKNEFPDLIVQDGEPIVDLVVNPNRIFLEPLRRQIAAVLRNQSLVDPTVLNDREADALAANYFATRNLGGYAIGVARLYFSAPRYASVTATNAVATSSGLRFFPVENQSISPDDMLFNVSGALYYFDIVVRAEEQSADYNITKGQLTSIENMPEVVRVENRVDFAEGDARESTTEFLARVEQELTEKSLVTSRGIRARLLNLFDSVRAVTVIGHNDVEMNRDIITGSPGETYAFGNMTASTATSSFTANVGNVSNGVIGADDLIKIGVSEGDVFRLVDLPLGTIRDFTVTQVISPTKVQVTPPPPNVAVASPVMILGPQRGELTLSGIPGGILQPQTAEGTIRVVSNEVHVGGMLDIFIRAGAPQSQVIEITGVRDGEPLFFGVDLEPFGADPDEFVQVTNQIDNAATTDTAYTAIDPAATIYIKTFDTVSGLTPWKPTAEDIGRYIQLVSPDVGLYAIQTVGEEQDFGGERAVPITISTFDQFTQAATPGISDLSSAYTMDFRVLDQISVQDRVRDRSLPQADLGAGGVGARVGDSVVIENGADAGIYTIRRILTWIGDEDTLILDRDLTSSSPTPSGAGDGSGLRYRVADELQLDLINPKVTKMPLGAVFAADDLATTANDATVRALGTSNFLLAGVEVGDTLEILNGPNVGTYDILDPVSGTELEISPPPATTANNQSFTVYKAFDGVQRPLVRVEQIELLDSSNQTTGITVPYGKEVDARVLGTLSNRAAGLNVESYTGQVVTTGGIFQDNNIDFVAQGVRPGDRIELLEGSSIGEFEIEAVAPTGGLTNNQIQVAPAALGADPFAAIETDIRYRVGQPSAGLARLYFLDPTSVNVQTGLAGGRLTAMVGNTERGFRFSEVPGRTILPAPGSGDDDPNDLRVVRTYDDGTGHTIVELTDTGNPDVFELELQEGDVLTVREHIPFRNSAGDSFAELGIFGTAVALRTVTGSNRVSVPANSHINFLQMGDLAGQTLVIESGADAGRYIINRVIDAKTLELDAVMVSTSTALKGRETATLYDAEIVDNGGNPWISDATDSSQLGAVGDFVTIFEAGSTDPEGTFEILAINGSGQRQLDGFGGTFPVAAGTFTWIVTGSGVVGQPFNIYQTVGKELVVEQVTTTADEVETLGSASVVAPLNVFRSSPGSFATVSQGDRLEILAGVNQGVYFVDSVDVGAGEITIFGTFSAISTGDPYRIWAGLHGPRRTLTLGEFDGSDGLLEPGPNLIYTIRRPALQRVSSTEMEEQVDDSGLYYIDLAIESLGPGDDRNLTEGTRLVVESGLEVDGYTYTVENNVLTFGMFEEVSLNFDRRFLPVGNSDLPENRTEINGRNLQIRYSTSSTVQLIDELFRSDSERPVNANPMARHFLPSFVRTTINYQGGSSTQVTRPDIEDYINTLGPLDELEVSDLEAILTRRGATSIRHPITLVAITHDIDRALIAERSEDLLGGTTVPYNGTARISSFFADTDDGLTINRG